MANAGKANKAVVKRLVEDVRFFAAAVREQSKKMMLEAEELKRDWDDPQYARFRAYMQELTQSLFADTKELDYCADRVEERELKEI